MKRALSSAQFLLVQILVPQLATTPGASTSTNQNHQEVILLLMKHLMKINSLTQQKPHRTIRMLKIFWSMLLLLAHASRLAMYDVHSLGTATNALQTPAMST